MHLLKDENGNPIPHAGGEGHGNEHEHSHCHGEGCGFCDSDGECKNETEALLSYMLKHNEHHAAELDQMADNLDKLGMQDASKLIREGVSEFQKGNIRLSLALTLVREHVKGAK